VDGYDKHVVLGNLFLAVGVVSGCMANYGDILKTGGLADIRWGGYWRVYEYKPEFKKLIVPSNT
jgi:hypothetical protein